MEERIDEWDMALVANSESVLFSQHDVLLDNEASINVFRSKELLKGIRKARKNVLLGGIQRGATGLRVTQEGDFNDVGTVYFNETTSANILSFASQIDAGADISYDRTRDRFVMIPAGGRNTYFFGRMKSGGSEGRCYVCDTRTMILGKTVP